MKGIFYPVYCLTIVLLSVGCSASHISSVTDPLPGFNLTGQWAVAGSAQWQNEIMFDFRPDQNGSFELKAWGHNAALYTVQLDENQLIFSYRTENGPQYHVLGAILSYDQTKTSRVQEAIDGFQPVGKLGVRYII